MGLSLAEVSRRQRRFDLWHSAFTRQRDTNSRVLAVLFDLSSLKASRLRKTFLIEASHGQHRLNRPSADQKHWRKIPIRDKHLLHK